MSELIDGLTFVPGSDRLYIPFQKIDDEQRMVLGYASTEKRDQQGEIVRRSAIEKALPDYMRFANIREMHQPSAVGIAKEAAMDDKGLWLGAHVVDDRAWTKVKAGVYKGFSVGGKVTSRDPSDRSVITGLNLTEISLVDRPANPEATFTVMKFEDGIPLPVPLQKWDCGVSIHQHYGKHEATGCMRDQLEKGSADQPRDSHGRWTVTSTTADHTQTTSQHENEKDAWSKYDEEILRGPRGRENLNPSAHHVMHVAIRNPQGRLQAQSAGGMDPKKWFVKKFDDEVDKGSPDQPRDDHGRWTSGGESERKPTAKPATWSHISPGGMLVSGPVGRAAHELQIRRDRSDDHDVARRYGMSVEEVRRIRGRKADLDLDMVKEIAAWCGSELELAKRETQSHSIESGRRQSVAQVIKEAQDKAKFHDDEMATAQSMCDRFKSRADKAGNNADSRLLVHYQEASEGFSHMVNAHRKLASFYRNLATAHETAKQ